MYQRTVDELQDELNSFDQRLSASATGSYKRKIYDLEAICCADLNRVKSRFLRSLQAFENTIDSIGQLGWQRMNPASCRCAVKKLLTENNADVCWHERQSSRNAKYDRSLPRSKYVETRARHAFMQKSSFMLAAIKLKLFRCSCAKNTVNALYRYRETEEYLYPLFGNVNTLKFVALWVVSNLVAVADKEKFEGCRGKRYNVRGLHCNRWDGRRLMQELVSIFNNNFSFLRHCMLKCDIRILILRRLRFLWAKDLFELRGSKKVRWWRKLLACFTKSCYCAKDTIF